MHSPTGITSPPKLRYLFEYVYFNDPILEFVVRCGVSNLSDSIFVFDQQFVLL